MANKLQNMINDQISPLTSEMLELFIEVNKFSEKLTNANALRHARFGICRRIRVIRINVCSILHLSDRPQSLPLYNDDQAELGMHLNSFYIHLHGALDNLAWMLAYEKKLFGEISEDNPEDRKKIGLFHERFKKSLHSGSVIPEFLESKKKWHVETKNLRDPIAHRIPLYAVPCIMTTAQGEEYNRLNRESIEALLSRNLELHDKLEEMQNKIGTYHPIFANDIDSNSAIYPIIETVENDSENLMEIISFIINKFDK